MSAAPRPPDSENFGLWFRREAWRSLKAGAVLLALGLAGIFALSALSKDFDPKWDRLNYQLTHTALEQHPSALLATFSDRLGNSEYGWSFLSWSGPFNVTAAREALRAEFPEFVGLDAQGQPRVLRSSKWRHAAPATQSTRAAAYRARYQHIESHRFTHLYPDENPLNVPSASAQLARMVTKVFGLPDAFLYTQWTIISAGTASILLFSAVLALAAVALWPAHRPARPWLKVLVWPALASALIWLAIVFMAISAALFGGLSPNTAALTLLATSPLLLLGAKTPLRWAEDLVFRTPPAKWDGIERRKSPRPPLPTETPPPPADTPPAS